MQLGMVGLGRMGANLVRRLVRDGHTCVVYDVERRRRHARWPPRATPSPAPTTSTTSSRKLEPPACGVGHGAGRLRRRDRRRPRRAAWSAGDIIIDGGNSYYRDDIDRAEALEPQGHPLRRRRHERRRVRPRAGLLPDDRRRGRGRRPTSTRSSAPSPPASATSSARPGRTGDPSPAELGYLHCGPNGAGHFVKMVHNGIEYGLMAAYAEGLNILQARRRRHRRPTRSTPRPRRCAIRSTTSTTSTPPRSPRCGGGAASSRRGCSTSPPSALRRRPASSAASRAGCRDSGEGRWTALAAIDEGVPAPVLTSALYERFSSRGEADFADKVLSAMRKEFGGHDEKPAAEPGRGARRRRPDRRRRPSDVASSVEAVDRRLRRRADAATVPARARACSARRCTCDGRRVPRASTAGSTATGRAHHRHPAAAPVGQPARRRSPTEADGTWVDLDRRAAGAPRRDGLPIHGTMTAAPGWRVEAHLRRRQPGPLLQCPLRRSATDPSCWRRSRSPTTCVVFVELSDLGLRVTTTIRADRRRRRCRCRFGWHPYLAPARASAAPTCRRAARPRPPRARRPHAPDRRASREPRPATVAAR